MERPAVTGERYVRFGARAGLVTAAAWLIAATVVAFSVAPTDWRLRVTVFGLASLTPAFLAIRPSASAAWAAAACWAAPGVPLLALEGLGAVWLVAAGFAFIGGITEGHRRGHPLTNTVV